MMSGWTLRIGALVAGVAVGAFVHRLTPGLRSVRMCSELLDQADTLVGEIENLAGHPDDETAAANVGAAAARLRAVCDRFLSTRTALQELAAYHWNESFWPNAVELAVGDVAAAADKLAVPGRQGEGAAILQRDINRLAEACR